MQKNDEKRCFLSILSEEKGRRGPKKITELNELKLGWNLTFMHASQGEGPTRATGPRDTCQGCSAPKHKLTHILDTLPYSACFWSPWSKDSLLLALAIVHSQPTVNRISIRSPSHIWDCTNPTLGQFIFVRLVQHLQMSWTSFSKPSSGVDSAPIVKIYNKEMLKPNLSLCDSFFSLFGGQRESFLMVLPQEACPWIFSPLGW